MDIIKKPYELSLWEDILVFVTKDANGNESTYEKKLPENFEGEILAQYFKERKICIIGSDTMTSPIRAIQPKLNSKINGENIVTFDLYSHYYDEDGEMYENPFVKLISNERKIKLRYGASGSDDVQWYDLIVKNIEENSGLKTFTYTAKDLFINELSKSGFNLVFDAELENNTGTINQLAKAVLEESDWKLEEADILREFQEEPLYKIWLKTDIIITDMLDPNNQKILKAKNNGQASYIYGFYSNIINRDPFLQLLYAENYEVDGDSVITNSKNWYIDNVEYTGENWAPSFANIMELSSEYRGKRLVRKSTMIYDATIDKYVEKYIWNSTDSNNGIEIYGFSENEYVSPIIVQSFITNPKDYESEDGWKIGGSRGGNDENPVYYPKLEITTIPHIRDVESDSFDEAYEYPNLTSYLKFETDMEGQVLYNSGVQHNSRKIDGFTEGEVYIFSIEYGQADPYNVGQYGPKGLISPTTRLKIIVAEYTLSSGVYNIDENKILFQGEINPSLTPFQDTHVVMMKCLRSLSYSESIKAGSIGIFIEPLDMGTIYIKEAKFFPYVEKNDGGFLQPEEFTEGEIKTLYKYYYPNDNYKSIEDVKYIYRGYTPAIQAKVQYDEKYEKKRSITISESNRFNIIQQLCEIFECWAKFKIKHEPNGEITLDENYQQQKFVSFHNYIGKKNWVGFKYGINLKQIQRTINSEEIVSKLVVKNNSNEFGKDGFCSIARANENPSGENFILDFNYYIHQKMLDISEITNDLYLDQSGWIGYYKKLHDLNKKRDIFIAFQSGILKDISNYSAQFQTYTALYNEAEEQYKNKEIFFSELCGLSFQSMMEDKSNSWWENDQVVATAASLAQLKKLKQQYLVAVALVERHLKDLQFWYDEINEILTSKTNEDSILAQKEKLNREFYRKYSRFLQEGSWISEDYLDDNLYFLDAQSILHTSSQPKVTYNIDVIEISQMEGYENFNFYLGDQTTIEDVEFFGWDSSKSVKTPYKEEIVVTETIIMLDSPEQNKIIVQNYKTQFEDLFQRIAATTQSIEYSTGKYQKASNIVNEDGTISMSALQNTMANNEFILSNAKDQSVIWDHTGITTSSLSKPSEMVRIISGGIFVTSDGGATWSTGITGKGINANLIYGGRIDTQEINIVNGSFPSFRWDSAGLNAYKYQVDKDGNPYNFDYASFVRLDQFGLYGMNGNANFNPIKEDGGVVGEDKIWRDADFALTWKGFSLKSRHEDGGKISITSDNDFEVINDEGIAQIKIGMLESGQKSIYGIRISDVNGASVLESSSDGKVWIKNELKIGNLDSIVSMGYLSKTKKDTNCHEVFNANDKFIVYEDGEMIASQGTFTGTIYATGGTIGGMNIADLGKSSYEIEITSSNGLLFKNLDFKEEKEEITILTATLYYGITPVSNVSYRWYKINEEGITLGTEKSLVIFKDMMNGNSTTQFGCEIEIIESVG